MWSKSAAPVLEPVPSTTGQVRYCQNFYTDCQFTASLFIDITCIFKVGLNSVFLRKYCRLISRYRQRTQPQKSLDGSRLKQNHPKLKRNRKHQHHRNETTTAIKLNSILLVCQTEFLKETVFLRSNSMHTGNFVFCVLCQIFERLRF